MRDGKLSSVARSRASTNSLGKRPSGIGVHIDPEKSIAKQMRCETSGRPTKLARAEVWPSCATPAACPTP